MFIVSSEAQGKQRQRGRAGGGETAEQQGTGGGGEVYHPVKCATCGHEVRAGPSAPPSLLPRPGLSLDEITTAHVTGLLLRRAALHRSCRLACSTRTTSTTSSTSWRRPRDEGAFISTAAAAAPTGKSGLRRCPATSRSVVAAAGQLVRRSSSVKRRELDSVLLLANRN